MHTHHKDLTVLDGTVTVLEVHRAGPQAFDLGARKGNAAFIGLLHEIIVPGLAVLCGDLEDGDIIAFVIADELCIIGVASVERYGNAVRAFDNMEIGEDIAVMRNNKAGAGGGGGGLVAPVVGGVVGIIALCFYTIDEDKVKSNSEKLAQMKANGGSDVVAQ